MTAANIVKFPCAASRKVHVSRPRRLKDGTLDALMHMPSEAQLAEMERERSKIASRLQASEALRADRKRLWAAADAERRFLDARMKLDLAVDIAQRHGLREALDQYPRVTPKDHGKAYTRYIDALLQQLLAPAPDEAAITWKERILYGPKPVLLDRDAKRVLLAIIDDKAFLEAHPARRSSSRIVRMVD